ncbi:hypothetical protein, partial [Klebsiella pneumoniae]|uniref:hypothetical protein n=1 Tax=Klebsiella pneumoniae TaxID=573 RepID=UPI0019547185
NELCIPGIRGRISGIACERVGDDIAFAEAVERIGVSSAERPVGGRTQRCPTTSMRSTLRAVVSMLLQARA